MSLSDARDKALCLLLGVMPAGYFVKRKEERRPVAPVDHIVCGFGFEVAADRLPAGLARAAAGPGLGQGARGWGRGGLVSTLHFITYRLMTDFEGRAPAPVPLFTFCLRLYRRE